MLVLKTKLQPRADPAQLVSIREFRPLVAGTFGEPAFLTTQTTFWMNLSFTSASRDNLTPSKSTMKSTL
jgi:hypothetical protein